MPSPRLVVCLDGENVAAVKNKISAGRQEEVEHACMDENNISISRSTMAMRSVMAEKVREAEAHPPKRLSLIHI